MINLTETARPETITSTIVVKAVTLFTDNEEFPGFSVVLNVPRRAIGVHHVVQYASIGHWKAG